MNLSDLRLCAVLAEERHFGRTALRASMTQPAVSLALKRVERHYGVRMFDRGRGPVSLTEAGERMLPHIQNILEGAETLRSAATRTEEEPARLRIGYSAWTRPAVRRLVCALQRTDPGTAMRLVQAPVPQQRRLLGEGELDIACIHTTATQLGHQRVPAVTFQLSTVATRHGVRSPGRRILLPDLDDEQLQGKARDLLARGGLAADSLELVGSPEELMDRLLAGEGRALIDPRMIPTGARAAASLQVVTTEAPFVPFEFVAAPGASAELAAATRGLAVTHVDSSLTRSAAGLTA